MFCPFLHHIFTSAYSLLLTYAAVTSRVKPPEEHRKSTRMSFKIKALGGFINGGRFF